MDPHHPEIAGAELLLRSDGHRYLPDVYVLATVSRGRVACRTSRPGDGVHGTATVWLGDGRCFVVHDQPFRAFWIAASLHPIIRRFMNRGRDFLRR